jgi:hypothetical protein
MTPSEIKPATFRLVAQSYVIIIVISIIIIIIIIILCFKIYKPRI